MKEFYFFIVIGLLAACNKSKKLDEFNSLSKKLNEVADKEAEKNKLLKEEIIFGVNKEIKEFEFYSYAACDMKEQTPTSYGVSLYDPPPLKVKRVESKDSIFVKLSFAFACSSKYVADLNLVGDSLKLSWKSIAGTSLECRCTSHYQFSLPKKVYPSPHIYVDGKLLDEI